MLPCFYAGYFLPCSVPAQIDVTYVRIPVDRCEKHVVRPSILLVRLS